MSEDSCTDLHDCPQAPAEIPDVSDMVGLALSGGGIRSASFNLGFLQGLAFNDMLGEIDYLSTVSGGGFIGAWWSAWLSRRGRGQRDIFPEVEELELDRRSATAVLISAKGGEIPAKTPPDASLSAQREDPIHFVRLFSNYLTPKTGVMSPDTWRLIAYFLRSLLCTWLALVPLLLAAVLAAQSIFLFNPHTSEEFLGHGSVAAMKESASNLEARMDQAETDAAQAASAPVAESQSARLEFLKTPALIVFAIYATLVVIWVIQSAASRGMAALAVAVLVGAGMVLLYKRGGPSFMSRGSWPVLVAIAATVLAFLAASFVKGISRPVSDEDAAPVYATPADRRTWLTQQQERVLKWGFFTGLLLLAAGFGHDILRLVFAGIDSGVSSQLKKAGGWGALVLTVVSGAYTLIKKAPSTSGQGTAKQSPVGRILMMIAPPLVVGALLLGIALLSQQLIVSTRNELAEAMPRLRLAAIGFAVVQVILAIYECYQDPDGVAPADEFTWHRLVPDFLLKWTGRPASDKRPRPWYYFFSPRGWARTAALSGIAAVSSIHGGRFAYGNLSTDSQGIVNSLALMTLAVVLILSFARITWRLSLRSARPVVLLSIASATATLCLLANAGILHPIGCATLLWVATLIGGVVAFGWLTDPNLVSLHGFYKARISRAYLGASNTGRLNEEVTDAVPGDDIPLKQIWNHDVGGPYHLINAAINLVGGSDLATSQRLAENFIMSRYHCGSARAGYRCTAEYMSGELSLATAVAISGAAVSPEMGSKSPSAALSLLLSLFNVRLGFWAPTPSGKRWYEGHARLWPFYLLRETLANTGTLGTYCYLTDGGHFDNTGLYALVERGCRYIVVCDCGADPAPSFEDIGTAVRRCRIDFGAELNLTINDFITAPNIQGTGTVQVAKGYITYQDEHLRLLGLDEQTQKHGTILWVKPTVTALSAADVRQYRRAHGDFPQQSTAEQWYDESQFESYRRLGYESALAAFPVADAFDPRGLML